jgi:uncharacterized protein YyaL (SSP411 family)
VIFVQGESKGEKKPNRLIREKSPYLLQHAYNPVDWYPWSDEAFEEAKAQGKPVFVSIGYSSCHWCHVMEKECFDDEEVAKLMNETFVCIKVDREERPDLDSAYMTVCQVMGRSCGWPLNIIMTAEKSPFFAASYIPKNSRFGITGMLELVPQINKIWRTRRIELETIGEDIKHSIEALEKRAPESELGEDELRDAYEKLVLKFDAENGGFGHAPKFPTPHNLLFLLRYWNRTKEKTALEIVEKTLRSMRLGGIFDQIGFGFHRYSTDAQWLVPHFEDADSEGEEGKFYLWTEPEVRKTLSPEDTDLAVTLFGVKIEGNYDEPTRRRNGKNILHLAKSLEQVAAESNLTLDKLILKLGKIRKGLFETRKKRVNPEKDDKVLADWNGLMIAALARASRVFGEQKYLKAAVKAADFVLEKMKAENGTLYHRYAKGEKAIGGFLDDYAFLVWGLIEIYEACFEDEYLQTAVELTKTMIARFWDEKDGGFYFTAKNAEQVIHRRKEAYDGALPSGNSVALLNLLRLARLSGDSIYEEKASRISKTFSGEVKRAPTAHTFMLLGVNFAIGPAFNVILVGDPDEDSMRNMLKVLGENYLPNMVISLRHAGKANLGYEKIDDKATAYVCRGQTCMPPTNKTKKMLKLLGLP